MESSCNFNLLLRTLMNSIDSTVHIFFFICMCFKELVKTNAAYALLYTLFHAQLERGDNLFRQYLILRRMSFIKKIAQKLSNISMFIETSVYNLNRSSLMHINRTSEICSVK